MYTQSSNFANVTISGVSAVACQTIAQESLATRAFNLTTDLNDLNSSLADLRRRIFGECEPLTDPMCSNKGPIETPPLQACVETAQMQTREAIAQVSSILNRL